MTKSEALSALIKKFVDDCASVGTAAVKVITSIKCDEPKCELDQDQHIMIIEADMEAKKGDLLDLMHTMVAKKAQEHRESMSQPCAPQTSDVH